MWALVAAVLSGSANAVAGCAIKGAQNAKCRIMLYGLVFMSVSSIFTGCFLYFTGGQAFNWGIVLLGILQGGLMSSAIVVAVLANQEGPPSLPWCMANLGLLVPIVISAAFLGETLRFSDILILGSFLLMLWFFKKGLSRANDVAVTRIRFYVLLLALVFLCNGLLMFGFKLNEVLFPESNKILFLFIMYCGAAITFVVFIGFKFRRIIIPRKPELKWGAASGLASAFALFFLQKAMSLPAIVAFPVMQGIALLGGVALMGIVYKEKVNRYKLLGVLAGLIVVLLSVFR